MTNKDKDGKNMPRIDLRPVDFNMLDDLHLIYRTPKTKILNHLFDFIYTQPHIYDDFRAYLEKHHSVYRHNIVDFKDLADKLRTKHDPIIKAWMVKKIKDTNTPNLNIHQKTIAEYLVSVGNHEYLGVFRNGA